MKYCLLLLLLFLIPIISQAQQSDTVQVKKDSLPRWDYDGYTSLNLNQSSLSNWAQGGESSISASLLFNFHWKYTTAVSSWENTAEIGYGFIRQEETDLRKNEDKIDINTKYGYKAFKNVFYTAQANFKTQFSPGYNYPDDSIVVSRAFAPAYLIVSLGMDYKPSDNFSIFISPVTGRFIWVTDQAIADSGSYSVRGAEFDSAGRLLRHGEKFRNDFGAYIRVIYNTGLIENINLETKLDLFNNYTDPNTSNRKNIDLNFEAKLIMKVNRFISANVFLQMIYDQDIKVPLYSKIDGVKTKTGEGMRLQVKEVAGLGFSYKF